MYGIKNITFIAVLISAIAIGAMVLMQSVLNVSTLTGQSLYGPWNAGDYTTEKLKETNRKLSACLNENTLLRSQLEARSKAAAKPK